jgi:hypothetical protein
LAPLEKRSPLLLDVPAALRGQDWQAVQECQPERWPWHFEAALADRTNSAAKQAATDGVVKNIESGWF